MQDIMPDSRRATSWIDASGLTFWYCWPAQDTYYSRHLRP